MQRERNPTRISPLETVKVFLTAAGKSLHYYDLTGRGSYNSKEHNLSNALVFFDLWTLVAQQSYIIIIRVTLHITSADRAPFDFSK